ncbi:MAG TPA: DUF6519 domain-containing protein [Thermomicrobiales bacterium]|nr:DUF6519 domain-containing protein [Thermomicrobiales bacterium]
MKGDFSRRTFDPADHYSAVLQEQGRMLTDADLEEEHRILAHRIETEALDLIGGCGGPIGDAGFEITPSAGQIAIGAGRYYVDGILVENDPQDGAPVLFTAQPHRPDAAWPPAAPDDGQPGRRLVYLDVWRRLITALDDPSIREVALGGPTTAAREQTVWQVRTAQVGDATTCLDPLPDMGATTGELAAQADPEAATTDPCEAPPTAGFKGLENQLYRVEVHDPGDAYDLTVAPDTTAITGFPAGTTDQVTVAAIGDLAVGDAVEVYAQATPLASTFAHITDITGDTLTLSADLVGFSTDDNPFLRRVAATFVWSRDNGSVVTTITRIDGVEITVRDLGRDDVLGFAPGQWVEISDDRNELEMRPGQLARIDAIDQVRRVVTLATPAGQLDPGAADGSGVDPALHPKLRRWDGAGAVRFNAVAPAGDWIHLEDGVQVRFTNGRYRTGDYWYFPARTATIDPTLGNIEWPRDGAGDPELLPPHGVEHHYCPLTMVDLAADGDGGLAVDAVTDCRDLFPPVTELTNLLYVGGDGQEGLPDPADPGSRSVGLDAPLQVRVANGSHPVAGVPVRFTIATGNGRLQGGMTKTVDVATDANGIATCAWQLDGSTPAQTCDARLLDVAGNPFAHQVVNFHATLSTAARVAYDPSACANLAGVKTVQEAIDRLCGLGGGGGRCCCVVIGPGGDFDDIQTAIQALLERGERALCLCLLPGDHALPGLNLVSDEPERPWSLRIGGCGPGTRLDVQDDLRVTGLAGFALRDLDIEVRVGATIDARQCREVEVSGCRISGLPPEVGLVRIRAASRVRVGHSVFESFIEPNLDGAVRFFDGLNDLQELYTRHEWRLFDRLARRVATVLSRRDPGERRNLAGNLRGRLDGFSGFLSSGEEAAYVRLIEALLLADVDALALFDHLLTIRLAVLRTDPGIALEIGELLDGPGRGFSAGGTRDGAAVIEANDIVGLLSLYGVADPGQEFNVDHIQRLDQALRRRSVRLGGNDLALHVYDNRLTRLVVAGELVATLRQLSLDLEGRIDELIASLHCTDNVIDGAGNFIVGHHVSLASNDFTLAAARGLEDRSNPNAVPLNLVIGDTGIYTGNHGQPANVAGAAANLVRIADITRASALAANLEIDFV